MKKYNVKINGSNYEIEIEEVPFNTTAPRTPLPAVSAPRPAGAPEAMKASVPSAPATVPQTAPNASAAPGTTVIAAPMPGNIITVNVSDGQTVKKGTVLFILEAMKMENEIMAPCDGTISSLAITAGSSVNSGTTLCILQ